MSEEEKKVEFSEEEGIEAIIYLQSLAGIEETEEQARRGWRGMREWEKKTTMDFYKRLKK